MKRTLVCAIAGAIFAVLPARADYPLAGRWTYDDVSGAGPAKNCVGQRMEFSATQRHDSKGGVHDYRNVSAVAVGSGEWRMIDEFVNGQVRGGRVLYTLTRRDDDHIELKMNVGGKVFRLRRCV